MNITYRTEKNLPCKQLYQLFLSAGWAPEDTPQEIIDRFNIGFIHSTFVFSAWVDGQLIGCVRALSDLHFRSILYDLVVLPAFQGKGIGTELVRRCLAACESSEWLVQTDQAKGFYERMGFQENQDFFLTIPCKWF